MKRTLEILIYEDEYRVVYEVENENGERIRKVRSFSRNVHGKVHLMTFLIGYLGIYNSITKEFKKEYER